MTKTTDRTTMTELPEMEMKKENREKSKEPSVRTYLTAKQEGKIIKKIFAGSKSMYHVAIHKLDESSDWKSASKIVEGLFIDNSINPFSKYAVAFTEAVSKKFHHG